MPNSKSLENLFQVGMTRDQFLDKYTEIKEKKTDDEFSIFDDDISTDTVGAIFDFVNSSTSAKDGKLDANEIKALKNLNKSDGEDVLSESDLIEVYKELAQKATKEYTYTDEDGKTQTIKYSSTDAKSMYDDVVTKGKQSNGDYLQNITNSIDKITALMEASQNDSDRKIDDYQNQINDLIQEDSQLSRKFKRNYKKTNSDVQKLKKEAEKYDKKMQEAQEKMEEAQNKISVLDAELKSNPEDADKMKEREKAQKEYDKYSGKFNRYKSQRDNAISERENDMATLDEMSSQVENSNTSTSSKIDSLKQKIEAEKANAKSTREGYEAQRNTLYLAQTYVLSKIPEATGVPDSYEDEDTANYSYDSKALKAKWNKKAGGKLSDGFYNKTVEISKRLGCDPNALMAVMYSESRFDPKAGNSRGGATGLIQFMPATARALGTSTAAIRQMSPERQLDYVEKCFDMSKRTAGIKRGEKVDSGTLYALAFLPAFAKREILTTKGTKFYNWNSGLDFDGNGQITKGDLSRQLHKFMP